MQPLDRAGASIQSGDELSIDAEYVAFTRCKLEFGWIVDSFIEHPLATEVVAYHKSTGEFAFFPLRSVIKKSDIKLFLNFIAPY